MPVTLLDMGRNGPAVGWPGFRSNVSIWLAPPFIHSRMQCLCFLPVAAATADALNR